MCRLLAILSRKELNPYPYIFDAKYCILKQAEVEKHEDGWGLCNIENGKITLVAKSIKPLTSSKEIASNLIKSISTKHFMFFIRLASNPRNLDKGLIIKAEATQPFYYNDIAFAHNGTIFIPDAVYKKISNFSLTPRSLNDSEVYFLAFLKYLEEEYDVYSALKKTEDLIISTFKESNSGKQYPFSSMNVIISVGDKLYAYNRYNSKYKVSVKDKEREYYMMCFKA
ncbi:MAG TPA: class II glutamine amidotransferase, partial [Geobacterales bacterium]|nr:class II glutamine amidotransferase [Geobacterales bacterium]